MAVIGPGGGRGVAGDDPTGKPGELSEFERIIPYGVAELPGREYPPAGHGYPRS